ncbi:MAG: dicarboxylate/amino acid:cation symporter [Muribaculaceae bacterium]|nr:dicarboxylate/amino acid:cation symporter [Muribaculaceae bacterium]
MKFKIGKINLLWKILAAIALGIGFGFIMPIWCARLFATFNAIFSQFLGFLIPLIIVGFVAPAIFEVGNKAGKMLILTLILAYLSTIGGGLLAYFVSDATFPSLISSHDAAAIAEDTASSATLEPFFTVRIPALMDVMTALVFSFLIGICMAYLNTPTLRNFFSDFRNVVSMSIGKVIIPLLPLYIFGIFLDMTIKGEVVEILSAFAKIIGVIFAMHIVLLLTQYVIAALFVRKNPFRMLLTMLPAYFTALGTQSSAATIPVTLRQCVKMGVEEEIAGFTVPLCATVHMAGSCMKITSCALALMLMEGMSYSTPMFIGFICMLGISMVAAPGVPGGCIMAALGLLAGMLGFSESDQALMIALYIAMDSFGTACNVTGDGAISQIVNFFFARRSPSAADEEATFQLES